MAPDPDRLIFVVMLFSAPATSNVSAVPSLLASKSFLTVTAVAFVTDEKIVGFTLVEI